MEQFLKIMAIDNLTQLDAISYIKEYKMFAFRGRFYILANGLLSVYESYDFTHRREAFFTRILSFNDDKRSFSGRVMDLFIKRCLHEIKFDKYHPCVHESPSYEGNHGRPDVKEDD